VVAPRGRLPTGDEIRIHVAPGTYVGSFDPAQLQQHPEYEVLPIILNVPKLAVLGSTVLVRDERGLPTATSTASESIVEPDTPLARNQYLILVTRTADGAVGDGVTVDGLVLDGRAEVAVDPGADVFRRPKPGSVEQGSVWQGYGPSTPTRPSMRPNR
jgi:hypothetical protein